MYIFGQDAKGFVYIVVVGEMESLLFSFEYFSHLVHASVAIVKDEKSQSQQILRRRHTHEERQKRGEKIA
jgi:hypothetical protein